MKSFAYTPRVSSLTLSLLMVVMAYAGNALGARRDSPIERERAVSRRDWRREALETMRVAAAGRPISRPEDLAAYRGAGFNTLALYDVNGYGDFPRPGISRTPSRSGRKRRSPARTLCPS